MRFGLFIPQGWRMDLVGIDPADQWATMNGLVTRADAGATFESVWVYDHFHTVPEPTQEATHEAWTLMAAFAATTSRRRRPSGSRPRGWPPGSARARRGSGRRPRPTRRLR